MVSGTTDRDTFWVNNAGTWVEFKDFEYFEVRKKQNQMSEFEVKIYDIQAAQKLYFKEQAEIIFFVGTTKVLKGRIQTIEYASEYECTAKGFGMEVKLLDKDLIKNGDKRVEYDNISAQTIAKQILSSNSDGIAPWIINPGTDGLFTTDYGLVTLRFEYANRMNCIGLLCNAIDYEWESYQTGASYENDYLRIKSLLGNQTSVKTFNIAGADANCTRTERNIDLNNLVNYVDVLGYGDGINQIGTSTYNASTTYSILSSDITASQTSITLVDASSFPSSGTIRIAKEIITYTGKSTNTLTGCTRGTSGTTAKTHKKNVYTERYFAKTTPQAGSSIATYGLMDYTMIDRTILDEDTLELIASGYLLERMTPIVSIKILSSEPMTDVALTIGDKVTVIDAESGLNGDYRIVGLKYIDNYGDISLEIEVSNRSLEFIEMMNKAREDQEKMGKYMQGATNIYVVNESENCDSTSFNFSDTFTSDSSANYTSDTFIYGGSGIPNRSVAVSGGRMNLTCVGTGAYHQTIFRRKTNYEIPAGTDFDFSVDVNRRTSDSYQLGIEFWNNINMSKYLQVGFDDYGNVSKVMTHLRTIYSGAPTSPSDPFVVRVRRVGSTYTCWVNGSQIYNGAIAELVGENLRYGVSCWGVSSPTVTAYASYDNWSMSGASLGAHPLNLRFYMPEDAIAINRVMLNVKTQKFRAYNQAANINTTGYIVASSAIETGGVRPISGSWVDAVSITTANLDCEGVYLVFGTYFNTFYRGSGTYFGSKKFYWRVYDGVTYYPTSATGNIMGGGIIWNDSPALSGDTGIFIPGNQKNKTFTLQLYATSSGDWEFGVSIAYQTISQHTHNMAFEIVEDSFPAGTPKVAIAVGSEGSEVPVAGSPFNITDGGIIQVDITNACLSVGAGNWINIKFTPTGGTDHNRIRIEANAYIQIFIQSR